MDTFLLRLCLIIYCAWHPAATEKAGVIVSIPKQGLQSLSNAAKRILVKQLSEVMFSRCIETSGYEFCLNNGQLYDVDFPNLHITPVPDTGIKLSITGARIGLYGSIWSGIFKDHIGKIEIIPENIQLSATINITTTDQGAPSFFIEDCSATTAWVYVHFYKSWKSWFYNLFFRSQVAKGVKGFVRDHLCENLRLQLEIQSFQMMYQVEDWLQFDYHFTSRPKFSNGFIDIFLKGEFKPTTGIKKTDNEVVTPLLTGDNNNASILIQVSEYTINTLTQTLQKSNKLKTHIDARDRRIPNEYKKFFCTSFLGEFIPKLKHFPNHPIEISIESHKAPKFVMMEESLKLLLVADATFRMKQQQGGLDELFVLRVSVNTSLSVNGEGNKITGKTTKFHYDLSVVDSQIGNISLTLLESPLVERVVSLVIMHGVDDVLEKGFQLPGSSYFFYDNLKVDIHKGNVTIAVEIAPPTVGSVLTKQGNVDEFGLKTRYNPLEMIQGGQNRDKIKLADVSNAENDDYIYTSPSEIDWNVWD